LKFLKIKNGLELHHDGDLPARSGMGSSSSFTVGLLHSLYAYQGIMPSKKQLADESIYIEQKMIKENVGSQDQVCVAYGGFNRIDFSTKDEIQIRPITISTKRKNQLNDHLMLFYTGVKRTASEVVKDYSKDLSVKVDILTKMREMVNLALSSQHRPVNVNLVGVGAGVSYDVAGPTHHCLEDISIMRTLPNIVTCSPCDWVTAEKFVDFSIENNAPKYIRLDSKPLPNIYEQATIIDWQKGFNELSKGSDTCIVSTGYMTHQSKEIIGKLKWSEENIGLIDVFNLGPDVESLAAALGKYKRVVTIEEGFKNRGGLDSLILQLINNKGLVVEFANMGFDSKYIFKSGSREVIYQAAGLSKEDMIEVIAAVGD
jgi:transketolase C-terminal domain/subunit